MKMDEGGRGWMKRGKGWRWMKGEGMKGEEVTGEGGDGGEGGVNDIEDIQDYNSHNTERQDVEGIKKLLMKLPIIRKDILGEEDLLQYPE